MDDLLVMRGIVKRYGDVIANNGACFSLRAGEIHAIAGENGAGKSTLMKILFGAEQADEGEILLHDRRVRISSPRDAAKLGIGMVYQHFMLVDELPVWQNVFLGIEKRRGLMLNERAMIEETTALCRRYDMPLDPNALCGALPVGLRQKVEILKVLARGATILILDEPTAVLTPQETEQLFVQLRLLRDNGHTIVIITHKLREIKQLCDRVTVMRGGVTMGVHDVADVSEQQISELMVGGSVRLKVEKRPAAPGEIAAELCGVTAPGQGGKPMLNDVSLRARAGEIVCLVGVEGNGQQQVVDCLTGLNRRYTGTVRVLGRDIKKDSVRRIRRMGLSHIPEDRMTTGTNQRADLLDNLIAIDFDKHCRLGFLRLGALRRRSEKQLTDFQVKGTLRQRIGLLSGGNMQKVVVARELSCAPKLLIADQPTRGVDVGAIAFIHEKLVALRDSGCAVVLVSADLGEAMSLADRIFVFRDGAIADEFKDVAQVTEKQLGQSMLGVAKGGDGR